MKKNILNGTAAFLTAALAVLLLLAGCSTPTGSGDGGNPGAAGGGTADPVHYWGIEWGANVYHLTLNAGNKAGAYSLEVTSLADGTNVDTDTGTYTQTGNKVNLKQNTSDESYYATVNAGNLTGIYSIKGNELPTNFDAPSDLSDGAMYLVIENQLTTYKVLKVSLGASTLMLANPADGSFVLTGGGRKSKKIAVVPVNSSSIPGPFTESVSVDVNDSTGTYNVSGVNFGFGKTTTVVVEPVDGSSVQVKEK
jgi:hypothetical protein